MLAAGYEQREERHKAQEKEKKNHTEKKRKQEYTVEQWDKEREKIYRKEMDELQRSRRQRAGLPPVSLPAESGNQPSWKILLQLKDDEGADREAEMGRLQYPMMKHSRWAHNDSGDVGEVRVNGIKCSCTALVALGFFVGDRQVGVFVWVGDLNKG